MAALGRRVPFLIVYYGSDGAGGWPSLDCPLRTLTTLDRFGLVTWKGSEPMLRMLQVDELKAAMGFPQELRASSRQPPRSYQDAWQRCLPACDESGG